MQIHKQSWLALKIATSCQESVTRCPCSWPRVTAEGAISHDRSGPCIDETNSRYWRVRLANKPVATEGAKAARMARVA